MYPFAQQLLSWQADRPRRRASALVLEVKGDFCHKYGSMIANIVSCGPIVFHKLCNYNVIRRIRAVFTGSLLCRYAPYCTIVYPSICDTQVRMHHMRKRPLTVAFVARVKTPGRYGDGGLGGLGLYLRVHRMKSGRVSKSWGQRIRVGGKPTNLGLGSYPVVTLREAREKALENRRAVHWGHDPRDAGGSHLRGGRR